MNIPIKLVNRFREVILNGTWISNTNFKKEFASLIEKMTEEKLNEYFVDEKYGTHIRNIDGMIEHRAAWRRSGSESTNFQFSTYCYVQYFRSGWLIFS